MNIEQARKLLGAEYEKVSNDEIKKIVDMIKTICSIVVESYQKEKEAK